MAVTVKRCVDCVSEGIVTKRKLHTYRNGKLVPGPRCATHHRAKRFDRRTYTHEKHILATYGITSQEYWEVYSHQGNRCAICRRATGAKKKLSVDHCHATGTVRGLLCTMCNKYVLGHLRDDPDALIRAANYLLHPPAVAVIGVRITPDLAHLTMNGEV